MRQQLHKILFTILVGSTPLLLLPSFTSLVDVFGDLYIYMLLALCGIMVGIISIARKQFSILYMPALCMPVGVLLALLLATIFSVERRFSWLGFNLGIGTMFSAAALFLLFWIATVWLRNRVRATIALLLLLIATMLVVVAELSVITIRFFIANQTTVVAHVSDITMLGGFALILTLALFWYMPFGKLGRSTLVLVSVLCALLLVALPRVAVPMSPSSPTFSDSFSVAGSLYMSQPLRVIVGTGLNTYANAWSKYKPAHVNQTPLWNVSYAHGVGLYDTLAVTGGMLSLCLLFVTLAVFGYRGVQVARSVHSNPVQVVSLITALYSWIMCIWYIPSLTVMICIVVVSAITVAFSVGTAEFRKISFTPGNNIWFMVGCLLVFSTALASFLVLQGKATAYYTDGIAQIVLHRDADAGQMRIVQAIRILSQPVYYRTLSEIHQQRSMQVLSDASLSKEDVTQGFLLYANAALDGARTAAVTDPENVLSWIVLGNVYAELASAKIPGASQKGIEAYDRAITLSPTNPFPLYLKAKLLLVTGDTVGVRTLAEQALALKPDYVDAQRLLQ